MNLAKQAAWVAFFLFIGVFSRWMPHPANFSAFMAIALFAGFVLPMPLAMFVPIASVFLGDLFLGFHDLMWVVYLSLLPMIFVGRVLPQVNSRPKTWASWAGAGLLASMFFFFTTNTAVWMTSNMYPHTLAGLGECYVAALPFFDNSVVATWIFLAVFEGVRRLEPARFRVTT